MTSVQRLISGRDNLVRNATLTASSVAPSTAISRTSSRRKGGGRVRLAGEYMGHESSDFEIEIVASGGIPRASAPVFAGVGNGKMFVQSVAAGATLQSLTFTLSDLGILTEAARLDVRDVQIRARTAGESGNAINIVVTPALTRTATDYSLIADWPAGQATQVGEQWNFSGLPMTAAGEVDAKSPRIQFGGDPQVFRPYRVYKDGQWLHGLAPTPERTITAGTKAFAITGGYEITVTNGVATEVYGVTPAAPIVTFYDMLTALAVSALVEVAGVVVADRQPGGQAATDVPLRTSAWLLSQGGKVALTSVSVPAAAPTQTVTAKCVNADKVGAERWEVAGSVSGVLASATTGTPYTSAAANFTIPVIKPANDAAGEWSFTFEAAARADSEGFPAICVRPFRFGPNARAKQVSFRYQARPPADCDCRDMPTPTIDLACLGLDPEGADNMEPAVKTRLLALMQWHAQSAASNTPIEALDAATGIVKADTVDLDLLDGIVREFSGCIREIAASPTALTLLDGYINSVKVAVQDYASGSFRLVESVNSISGFVPGDDGNEHPSVSTSIESENRVGTVGGSSVYTKHYSGVATVTSGPNAGVMQRTEWTLFYNDASIEVTQLAAQMREDYKWQARPAVDPINPEQTTVEYDASRFLDRVRAQCNHARVEAGIFPKSDASSTAAGGCWQDDPKATHWWVDTAGYYRPAFTNRAYVSTRMDTETGATYSTQEFAFGLVVACPDRLKIGDTIVININQTDGQRPYSVGDEAVLQTVAAGPAYLAGGINGTDRLTWDVTGSDSGPLAKYLVPISGPVPAWSGAGAEIKIEPGGIPFSLGDTFSLAIEAGQYKWRRDGGAWSAATDIPFSGPAALADGVAAHFDPGAAPSWVDGDASTFRAHQPHAPSQTRHMRDGAWQWSGNAASIVIDIGSEKPVGGIVLARYRLPVGATVSYETSINGTTWSAPALLDITHGIAADLFEPAATRYLRITLTDAPAGEIGAIWAGVPAATSLSAAASRQRRWGVSRSGGINPSGLYAGQGDGWKLTWEDCLSNDDAENLLSVIDYAQRNDEPLVLIPHHLHLADAALVAARPEALEIDDLHEYQPNDAARRLLSATLTLDAVIA